MKQQNIILTPYHQFLEDLFENGKIRSTTFNVLNSLRYPPHNFKILYDLLVLTEKGFLKTMHTANKRVLRNIRDVLAEKGLSFTQTRLMMRFTRAAMPKETGFIIPLLTKETTDLLRRERLEKIELVLENPVHSALQDALAKDFIEENKGLGGIFHTQLNIYEVKLSPIERIALEKMPGLDERVREHANHSLAVFLAQHNEPTA